MARHDLPPAERDQRLHVDAILTCPKCGTEFDHVFTAPPGISETEDIVDPMVEWVECPERHRFKATWEGWVAHDDAG